MNLLRRIGLLSFALTCIAAAHAQEKQPTPLPIQEPATDAKVEFSTVEKILRKNCVACHSGSKAENGLVMESPAAMLKGGESGVAIVSKNSAASLVFRLAAHLQEPVMPPTDNKVNAAPLSPIELGLLKRWIDQGAAGQSNAVAPLTWQALPKTVSPIYAVAVTSDGSTAAAGRGNEIPIVETATGRTTARLVDPALSALAGARGEIAHLDIVQSLAFHPDGDLLASGGYREIKLWRRQAETKLGEFPPVGDAVASSCLSSDEKLAAVGDRAGVVRLYDLESHKPVREIAAHAGSISGIRFSANGALLFTGGDDKLIKAWNVADGTAAGEFETPSPIRGLALVSGGKRIVTGHEDKLVRVWSPPTLPAPVEAVKPDMEFKGHNEAIVALAGVPDSKYVVSADRAGSVRVWSLESRSQTAEFSHGGQVAAVAVSHDGKRVASAGENGSVRIFSLADNKQLPEIRGDLRARYAVAKAERTANLAKAKIDEKTKEATEAEAAAKKESEAIPKANEVKIAAEKTFDAKSETVKKQTADKKQADEVAATALETLKSKQDAFNAAETSAKADDQNADLRSALKKAEQQLKQATTEAKAAEKKAEDLTKALKKPADELQAAELTLQSAQRGVESSMQSAAKAAEVAVAAKNAIAIAEQAAQAAAAALLAEKALAAKTAGPFRAVAFSLDGGILYTAGDDGLIQAWSAETAGPLAIVALSKQPLRELHFGPNGIFTAAADRSLTHWSTARAWTLERTIGKADDPTILVDRVLALEFSPDGKLLASGGGEPSRSGEVKFWNPQDGTLVKSLTDPHSDTVFAVRFSPDGALLATCGADRFVKVFDVAQGTLEKSFEGHTHHVLAVAWRMDGRTLASGSADHTVKIWDLKTGEQKRTVTGYDKEITALDFIADSMKVLVACGDNTLRVLNTDNAQNERSLRGNSDFVYSGAVSADGKVFVGGGQDGILRIWDSVNNEPIRSISD